MLRSSCALVVAVSAFINPSLAAEASLRVGFGEREITPKISKDKPVYLAGFGHNRRATGVHDPLMARAVVLQSDESKIALVSVDLVGFFHHHVVEVRKRLPGYRYVLVSSTHNHEGPDTLGLWGASAFQHGVDAEYVKFVQKRILEAVRAAEKDVQSATARIGSVRVPELLHDARLPKLLHDELVVLEFLNPKEDKRVGLLVSWHCHPETLGSKNTLVSSDYVHSTVARLSKSKGCPVAYFTGTVGGLLTSLHVDVKNEKGKALEDGTFEKTERYGVLVADAAERALKKSEPIRLTPFEVRTKKLYLPVDNPLYQFAWQLGVLRRPIFGWEGDIHRAKQLEQGEKAERYCAQTELGWLRLGELEVAAIPGEIYPELVLDKVETPAQVGADFPKAATEPAVYNLLKSRHRILIGLANDEMGYIIPKRQWDEKPPFCYGRKKSQYGEINSLGPETAPLLLTAFRDLVRPIKKNR